MIMREEKVIPLLVLITDTSIEMAKQTIVRANKMAQRLNSNWGILCISSTGYTEAVVQIAQEHDVSLMTIADTHSMQSLVDYVRMNQVQDVVMAYPTAVTVLQRYGEQTLHDFLSGLLPDTSLHIVPFKGVTVPSQYDMMETTTYRKSGLSQALVTVLIYLSATLLAWFLSEVFINIQSVMLIYITAILLTAQLTNGYRWSTAMSIVTVMTYNWLFMEPRYAFNITEKDYLVTLIFMLCFALLFSNMVYQLKHKAQEAKDNATKMRLLNELERLYHQAEHTNSMYIATTDCIGQLIAKNVTSYDVDNQHRASFRLDSHTNFYAYVNADILQWVNLNQRVAGYQTNVYAHVSAMYLPIKANTVERGVLVIDQHDHKVLSPFQLQCIELILNQLANALQQYETAQVNKKVQQENEQERLRSNFLRAMSHDIRTPLTNISGIAETLLSESTQYPLTDEVKRRFLREINQESKWLIRMAENLLSITRINMTDMQVKSSSESVEELLESAISRIRSVYKHTQIQVEIGRTLPFVSVDPILIVQVLFNLIENAIRYGKEDAPIQVNVLEFNQHVRFQVINQGSMDQNRLDQIMRILDKRGDTPIDSTKGMGIGISIVHTILQAHRSRLIVKIDKETTCFEFNVEREEGQCDGNTDTID